MKRLILALMGLVLAVTATVFPAAAQDSYKIKPGDVLRIEVLEDASLNRSTLVLPDGRIALPLAGTLQARGMTLEQVQGVIAARIAANFAPHRRSMSGWIRSPCRNPPRAPVSPPPP